MIYHLRKIKKHATQELQLTMKKRVTNEMKCES